MKDRGIKITKLKDKDREAEARKYRLENIPSDKEKILIHKHNFDLFLSDFAKIREEKKDKDIEVLQEQLKKAASLHYSLNLKYRDKLNGQNAYNFNEDCIMIAKVLQQSNDVTSEIEQLKSENERLRKKARNSKKFTEERLRSVKIDRDSMYATFDKQIEQLQQEIKELKDQHTFYNLYQLKKKEVEELREGIEDRIKKAKRLKHQATKSSDMTYLDGEINAWGTVIYLLNNN